MKKSAAETAEYVYSQLNELARLSQEAGLDILAYLIEIAAMEATNQCRVPR